MKLGRVVGTVNATEQIELYTGRKLLVVRFIEPDGSLSSRSTVAIDVVQAGVGDTVLILDEGNSARMILKGKQFPARTVVAGVVDRVDLLMEAGNG
jgi:microcompartment protein CcmK/EutM